MPAVGDLLLGFQVQPLNCDQRRSMAGSRPAV